MVAETEVQIQIEFSHCIGTKTTVHYFALHFLFQIKNNDWIQ